MLSVDTEDSKMIQKKTYSEASKYKTYEERFNYLKLNGVVAENKFGSRRYMNQDFYKSNIWKTIRNKIIIRDNGNDLGVEGCEIQGPIYIHHIEPLTPDQFQNMEEFYEKYNSEDNLICCSRLTHNAIHYQNEPPIFNEPVTRKPNDTCPWKI